MLSKEIDTLYHLHGLQLLKANKIPEVAAAVEKAAFHEEKSITCSREKSRKHSYTEFRLCASFFTKCHIIYFSQKQSKTEFLILVFTDETTAPEKLSNLPETMQTIKVHGKIRTLNFGAES